MFDGYITNSLKFCGNPLTYLSSSLNKYYFIFSSSLYLLSIFILNIPIYILTCLVNIIEALSEFQSGPDHLKSGQVNKPTRADFILQNHNCIRILCVWGGEAYVPALPP